MISVELGGAKCNVYSIYDFPYKTVCEGVQRVERGKRSYWNIVSTFDIESSNVVKGDKYSVNWGFMYVWQFCVNGYVVMGRTWSQFKEFLENLKQTLGRGSLLVCYVHNLQFEFQFFRNFFNINNVFCRKKRQVVYCVTEGIEFRCSYILSNMPLKKFLEKQKGVHWFKQSDKFNYSKMRYPDTELSLEEILYCVCDVLGLWEAICSILKYNDCDLISIPYTSTGFVRQDYRKKCLYDSEHMKRFKRGILNGEQYILLSEASRGAISGSNACYTGWTINCLDSFDIKSSYPYQMATKYFPYGKFSFVGDKYGSGGFCDRLYHCCCIIVWSAENFKLKEFDTIPYISKAKCKFVRGGLCGNGKVYRAKEIGMCCTEIDFRLICERYSFENPVLYKMMCADRGMLSKAFRGHLLEMFQFKTDLEDGDEFDYAKYKNKINASFGMLLTDILHPEIVYNAIGDEPFKTIEVDDFESGLSKYYSSKNSFLSYQDGVWVLAHGRDDLCRGMSIVGEDIVQVDTDSVKCDGDYVAEFNALNDSIIAMAEDFDIKPYAIRSDGEKVYLGVWEHEKLKGTPDGINKTYKQFRTLGAKKYAYADWKDEVHITVSGVGKNEGAEFLKKHGGLSAFVPDKQIPPGESGRLIAYYNDEPCVKTVCIDGHFITYGSNVCLLPGAYTFGVTDEWEAMISGDWDWEIDDENQGVGEGYLG